MLFGQGQALGIAYLVFDQHKHQVTAAAGLVGHRFDAGAARDRVADLQHLLVPMQAAARPHAARQRHRRQKPAALRMAVGAQAGLAYRRQKVQPVPQLGQRRARDRIRIVAVQRGRQCTYRRGGDAVAEGFGLADPNLQLGEQVGVDGPDV